MTTDSAVIVLGTVVGFWYYDRVRTSGDQDLEAGGKGFVLRHADALFVRRLSMAGVWSFDSRASRHHHEFRYGDSDRDCYRIEGVDSQTRRNERVVCQRAAAGYDRATRMN
jgi:hypothetical protein